jgi:hypothetical protein
MMHFSFIEIYLREGISENLSSVHFAPIEQAAQT